MKRPATRISLGLTAADARKLESEGVHVSTTPSGARVVMFFDPLEICSKMADVRYRMKRELQRQPALADLRRIRRWEAGRK